jgi:hypothetical protein
VTNNENPNMNEEIGGEPKTPLESFIFHQRKALEETGKALEALLPEGFREHGSEAGREFARSFKVLVDAAIDELRKVSEKADDEGGNDKPSTTGKTKVKVQVD